ncbi:MAG: hypothetical protein ACT4QD_13710, partial [Acidobacteriota bacterium]
MTHLVNIPARQRSWRIIRSTQEDDTDPGRWREVSRIFADSAALDRPQRDGFVAEACRHDRALRAAVDSLLKAHDQAG